MYAGEIRRARHHCRDISQHRCRLRETSSQCHLRHREICRAPHHLRRRKTRSRCRCAGKIDSQMKECCNQSCTDEEERYSFFFKITKEEAQNRKSRSNNIQASTRLRPPCKRLGFIAKNKIYSKFGDNWEQKNVVLTNEQLEMLQKVSSMTSWS